MLWVGGPERRWPGLRWPSVAHQDAVARVPSDHHVAVPLLVEGLLAQPLDDEDLLADAYLVLDAGAEGVFVVELAGQHVLRILAPVDDAQLFRPHHEMSGRESIG